MRSVLRNRAPRSSTAPASQDGIAKTLTDVRSPTLRRRPSVSRTAREADRRIGQRGVGIAMRCEVALRRRPDRPARRGLRLGRNVAGAKFGCHLQRPDAALVRLPLEASGLPQRIGAVERNARTRRPEHRGAFRRARAPRPPHRRPRARRLPESADRRDRSPRARIRKLSRPRLRPCHRLLPPGAQTRDALARHRRLEPAIDLPVLPQRFVVAPVADRRGRRGTRRRAPWSRAPRGRTTGTPSRSAWICISRSFAAAPPSTRSARQRRPGVLLPSRSSRSALWSAIALERRAREVRRGGAAREADDRAARVADPSAARRGRRTRARR